MRLLIYWVLIIVLWITLVPVMVNLGHPQSVWFYCDLTGIYCP